MPDDRYAVERRRQMLIESEPFMFGLFYAAAMAAGKRPTEEADKALRAWRERYPLPDADDEQED